MPTRLCTCICHARHGAPSRVSLRSYRDSGKAVWGKPGRTLHRFRALGCSPWRALKESILSAQYLIPDLAGALRCLLFSMWILPFVGYAGLLLGFGFLTLAIGMRLPSLLPAARLLTSLAASGLYYLSELVEEHTVPAKKFLTRLIYAVIASQILLLVDRLPLLPCLLSVVSHAIYLQNLRYFPIVRLSDPIFITSCSALFSHFSSTSGTPLTPHIVLVLLNHWLWFRHFSAPPPPPSHPIYSPHPPPLPSFTEVASFFFLQVWLVPFALFVSLSASDNVLPSMGSEYATDPNSPLATPSSVIRSPSSLGLPTMSAMLSPRSPSASGSGQRSPSAVRGGSLGLDDGRRKRRGGAKGLVRVAVDGVREWVGESAEAMGLWQGERARRW